MSRPLRVMVRDGWYLVTARGIEQRAVFRDRHADRVRDLALAMARLRRDPRCREEWQALQDALNT